MSRIPAPTFLKRPFSLTYELNPPRSTEATKLLQHAGKVASSVDAFNLTDCPMSNLRMSPVGLAAKIQTDLGVATIPHITARDRNLLGIQSELLGLAFLGIRHVFALTGDPIKIGDHPAAKPVFELYANQLIALVQGLNGGRDHVGNKVEPPTRFSVGAAVTLTDARPDGPATFAKKLEAGADFFQTQIVLDPSTLESPTARQYETDRPVLIGTTPLRSRKMLETFRTIPGVEIPPRLEARLSSAKDFAEEANRAVLDLRDAVKGRYAGLHLMPVSPDDEQVLRLLSELRGSRSDPVVAARAEDPR